MFWTITTFLLLVVVLGKYAWKPMIRVLEEREDSIRRAIQDAATAKQDAETMKAALEKEIAAGQSRMRALMLDAQADAAKVRDQLVKEAEAEARRLAEQSRRQLEEEKLRLSRDLRREAGALSIQIAEKLLRHQVNVKEQETLVQGILKDLDGGAAR